MTTSVSGGVGRWYPVADILCCVASLVVAVGAAERTLFRSGDDVLRMLIVAYGPYVHNVRAVRPERAGQVQHVACGRHLYCQLTFIVLLSRCSIITPPLRNGMSVVW